ncbi:Spx/MgsR family RNA polymerase-binding regulatory protein [Nodosilinea sp. PGN35]|uniref:Spx/MgsR family RNA polymerase-binding regulatory protein n=1 Tax=Nodosilinea sp. PGN35 TaxID=3020489 RepID=UPI0023B242CD|nr:Spx/MgsR family RNA polymerase-binding regulatory protein [Nodosilinea sp. TSF1-S3]MDF0366457.1 Spx/MgsR family RNA polymerase-binding regulatory protein [Nodosilinea sp. TSF1-S3]
MTLTVYGIPTCGTCKKARQWLDSHAIAYDFINTKEQPPSRATVAAWVEALGSRPMRNTSGQSYRALGDDKQTWGDPEWIDAFSRDAMLLKRPLFVKDGQAVLVGFRASEAELNEILNP